MPGPVDAMPAPEPTNRPAPITPPMAIIDRWRFLSPALRWPSPPWPCPPCPAGGRPAESRGGGEPARVVVSALIVRVPCAFPARPDPRLDHRRVGDGSAHCGAT